ncbi:baseplate J/gp47 family protein [Desulfosporosinus sp. PR]|uniref:baseplate J/gp47 family protein n=1 Tax=Candidatus Desulfosporosinus nitrosoreducens TaxID=3401928 RepID=UPI0027ED56AF|nr:baseplate J/gp47 family protein [Desulfosporosinus sp. PR]MDQ7096373.1 baseplate J/gp47 family protein [Desulfosporosinus sp. PR]
MYEDQTYDAILTRMLARVSDKVDKREGSLVFDALAAVAAELAQFYVELNINTTLSFADTATDEYLTRRTAEFGVNREEATKAQRKGEFFDSNGMPMDIPLGSRYGIGGLAYTALEQISTGVYILECETAGVVGNQQFGNLLPIIQVDGLARAELEDVLVPGEEEEENETLRTRYYEVVNEPSYGGKGYIYSILISSGVINWSKAIYAGNIVGGVGFIKVIGSYLYTVYYSSNGLSGYYECLQIASQTTYMTITTKQFYSNATAGYVMSNLVIVGTTFYFDGYAGTSTHNLYTFDLTTGNQISSITTSMTGTNYIDFVNNIYYKSDTAYILL